MKMMKRKAYTAFGETGYGEMGFSKTGFGETGRHLYYSIVTMSQKKTLDNKLHVYIIIKSKSSQVKSMLLTDAGSSEPLCTYR